MRSRIFGAVSAAALSVLMAGQAAAATIADAYSSYWALGDSLSDNGNLSFLAYAVGTELNYTDQTGTNSYYTGRFTNGRTWAEYVADDFTAAGKATGNLAYGGSEALEPDVFWDLTPGLDYQRKKLLNENRSDFGTNPLVSIVMGANDLLQAMGDSDILDVAVRAANKITSTARTLANNGVSDFLIANLPDFSTIPRYNLFQTSLKSTAKAATDAFNAQLYSNILGMRADGLNVATLDLHGILADLQADPASYGLTDAVRPCLYPSRAEASANGDAQSCSDSELLSRLFFDDVHPSARIHEAFGDAVREALAPAPVPLPASLPLMLGGVAILGFMRRKLVA